MKVIKPKDNQLLFEDDVFKDFDLEVKSNGKLNDSGFDKEYEGLIIGYRLPGMNSSKQMFFGNRLSIITLITSMLENTIRYNLVDKKILHNLIDDICNNLGVD